MLETDSDRQLFNPNLDQKIDSMFYTLGILKSVQQAADTYVLTNEMRGDLVTTNSNTETAIRQLANYTAEKTNSYDSAYVYYRIINNCNYYITHRDTTLRTGDRAIAIPEYAEAKAIRAWAYLQLVKAFGPTVPYYTKPLLSIADVSTVKSMPKYNITQLCEALIPDLLPFAGTVVPNYNTIDAGATNSGNTKRVASSKLMIPVDIILGDLYLESNQYENAAKSYYKYLTDNKLTSRGYKATISSTRGSNIVIPNDFRISYTLDWTNIFDIDAMQDIITLIPFAVNRLNGTVSNLPKLYGYDFYSTANSDTANIVTNLFTPLRQLEASNTYKNLASAQNYYYNPSTSTDANNISESQVGDLRYYSSNRFSTRNDSNFFVNIKLASANVPVYRVTTVWLRFAEAVNRMGYPDLAFAILKDGISTELETATYLSDKSKELITSGMFPFLSTQFGTTYTYSANNTIWGIHSHGSGITGGENSPYKMDEIVKAKLEEMANQYGITVNATKYDTINAIEDIICDEYALEFAFEGNRFSDLLRFANHKNNESGSYVEAPYAAQWGTAWLNKKLSLSKGIAIDESKWYLPFN